MTIRERRSPVTAVDTMLDYPALAPGRFNLDRQNSLDRLAFKISIQVPLEEAAKRTEDPELLYWLSCAYNGMERYSEVCEAVIARHEAKGEWDRLRLLQRQLSGLLIAISSLVEKRPEKPCGAFKAREMNRVISEVKALVETDLGVSLSLVSESEESTYSDAFLILQACAAAGSEFARRHYDGSAPSIPPDPVPVRVRLTHDDILDFCREEPRSAYEIMKRLGYRDKKTVRKYLRPLLKNGWLLRTVPDKPNSRSQRYITARSA